MSATGNPRIEDAIEALLATPRGSVTMPAGAGKTELIAAAVETIAAQGGTSLVLTHTHAGVDALRRRMKKRGVPPDKVVVRTIDSWAVDLVAHFPDLSGFKMPPTPDWSDAAEYHLAAAKAVGSDAVARMLKVTYSRAFVDEYQDCTLEQHNLALAIAHVLPASVLGDPLQSLFKLKGNRAIEWEADVEANFPAVAVEHRPRRWDPDHHVLGAWLLDIRANLISGVPINLDRPPVTWKEPLSPRAARTQSVRRVPSTATVPLSVSAERQVPTNVLSFSL